MSATKNRAINHFHASKNLAVAGIYMLSFAAGLFISFCITSYFQHGWTITASSMITDTTNAGVTVLAHHPIWEALMTKVVASMVLLGLIQLSIGWLWMLLLCRADQNLPVSRFGTIVGVAGLISLLVLSPINTLLVTSLPAIASMASLPLFWMMALSTCLVLSGSYAVLMLARLRPASKEKSEH